MKGIVRCARIAVMGARRGIVCVFGLMLGGGLAFAQDAPTPAAHTLRIVAASTAGETGLIASLARAFESRNPGTSVQLDVVGALAALDRAREGRADIVITHHEDSEALFVAEGYGLGKTLVMYNEFAIFGPPTDPLHLRRETDIRLVLRRLATQQVSFLSPGQRSGTFRKLSELWTMTGIEPGWPGYEVTGESSAATLRAAAQFNAYAFADIGTYLTHRSELAAKLAPLVRDNVALRNYYSAIVVSDAKVPSANQPLAEQFMAFLVSVEGQEHIRQFGEDRFGAQIFIPAAHLDEGLRARRATAELKQKTANLRRLMALAIVLALATGVAAVLFIRGRRFQLATRRSEERFALAIAGANDGIWDWDLVRDCMYFSPRLQDILNFRPDSPFVEAPRTVFAEHVHPDDHARMLKQMEEYVSGTGVEMLEAEFRWHTKPETHRWILMRGKALRDASNKCLRMSGSITDISQRKVQEEVLLYQALYDALTDLPNRTLLLDRIEQAIRAAGRTRRAVGVLVLGIDRFKEINDTLGYDAGDTILREMGVRLSRTLRNSDTVARLGGDEFAILLPDVAGEVYTNHVVTKLSQALSRPFEFEQHALHVAASIGIAMYPEHGEDADTLVRHAGIAMDTAKRAASGCAMYEYEQDQGNVRRLALASDLHDALEQNGISAHFQPQIDMRTGMVTGVEALLRWEHPRQGQIRPDEVIPIAERTGLIKPLTLWMLDASLQQHVEWAKQGMDLKVAVNLSVWSLQDPKLAQEIQATLDYWRVLPTQLELEITETAMMSDPRRSLEILTQLHQMGIALSMDDFGTGFSSLSYLKRMPVQTIKIDKSFVMTMDVDENSAIIVRSTIELAHNLGLNVIAEGVESKVIMDRLRELGCDTAQGYYFCRPISGQACTKWLRESDWGMPLPAKAKPNQS